MDRDASPERPRGCRHNHYATGPWRPGKYGGGVLKVASRAWMSQLRTKNGYLWRVRFTESEHGEHAHAKAKAYHKEMCVQNGKVKNMWRPLHPNHIEIRLSQNTTTIVDQATYEIIKDYTWSLHKNKKMYYPQSRIHNEVVLLHQLILETKGKKMSVKVDHLDRDGLHNCSDNIWQVFGSQNERNCTRRSDNVSGVTGISVYDNAWNVECMKNGNRYRKSFKIPQGHDPTDIPANVLAYRNELYSDLNNFNG